MARWKLQLPHYLKVPGTRWELKQINQGDGEEERVLFDVPRYLHPDNPRDCRSPEGCVVAYSNQRRGDWVFFGDPTPDMEPLDEEAEKITERLRPKWSHAIDDLPAQGGYGDALAEKFERAITEAMSRVAAPKDQTIEMLLAKVAELSSKVEELAAPREYEVESLAEVEPLEG